MVQSSSPKTDTNRSAILAYLATHGPVSRAELSRSLDVSAALITQLTRDLITQGLIQELTQVPSQGGRPGRALGISAMDARSIGVKLAADHLTFVEVAIAGDLMRSVTLPFEASSPMAVSRLVAQLRRFIDASPDSSILGIGIGAPGYVSEQSEGIVDSTLLGWNRVPLGDALRREFGLPVVVDNDVNSVATAERLFGEGRRHTNALVVSVGVGIGGALFSDGSLIRGAAGDAGSIGHIPVVDGGPACQCGNQGCLEAVVGQAALLARAREAGLLADGDGIGELAKLADCGDASARGIFADAGRTLGRAVAGVVNLFNPDALILLGEGLSAWAHWSSSFEDSLRRSLLPVNRALPVVVEDWTDDSWAQGAAALVLATPFDARGIAGDQGQLVRERLILHASAASGALR